ncbi:MAG TPA: glycerol-3-phosphate 1-O-acyltransferase PlsY [Polyangia bacterium]
MQMLFLIGAFLLGSFPTGVVVATAKNVDLRKVGSGNIGTANVSRALGKGWAALVLVVDAGKGFLPIFLAARIFDTAWLPAAAGLVAVLGQVFSVFLKGRGGKGVATSLGAGLALAPLSALACVALWIALFLRFRISSIASLAAVASFPTFLWLFHQASLFTLGFAAATGVLVLLRHKDNLRRLLRGEEQPTKRIL